MSLFNSEQLDSAITVLEARIRLHRGNCDISAEELEKRRQLYEALHKLKAVREGLAVRTPTGYLH
jgi:hypothetical protein